MKIPLDPPFSKGEYFFSLWQSLPTVGKGGWEGFKEAICVENKIFNPTKCRGAPL
jgi:hypothetical protein